MLISICTALLQDSIDGNEKPGPFTALFSKKSENISKAQQKNQLFSEKDYYAKLGPVYIPQRKEFMNRIEKKIEDIEKNMPQKYDDLEQDKRYRDAILYPLKYTLMVNRNFDDFFAALNSEYNRIDNSY